MASAFVTTPTLFPARAAQWRHTRDGDRHALAMYERHYSAHRYADGRRRDLFVGPGEKTVLLTHDGSALFVWRKFKDDSGQQGINCAVFRNEGHACSSDLIIEADDIAWTRWPGARLYTYVKGSAIRSTNPGYCFIKAGWRKCGRTKNGLVILEKLPDEAIPSTTRASSPAGDANLK